MAENIATIPFRRGSIDYILYQGTDAEGEAVDYIDEVAPDSEGRYFRWLPDEIRIKRDASIGKGGLAYILTSFVRYMLDVNGKPILATAGTPVWMETSGPERKGFIALYGGPIMKSGTNIFIRSGLGFNKYGVFNPMTGAVLTYTPAQEDEAPDFAYGIVPPTPAP